MTMGIDHLILATATEETLAWLVEKVMILAGLLRYKNPTHELLEFIDFSDPVSKQRFDEMFPGSVGDPIKSLRNRWRKYIEALEKALEET